SCSIGAAGRRTGLADLQHEFSVLGKFQHLAVVVAIAAEPDEALVIDIDAMLVLEPVIALARATPGAQHVPFLVKFDHRRRRHAAFGAWWNERRRLFIIGERARALDDPDVVLRIDRYACSLPHDPVVGERFGPRSVDLEL